MTIPATTLFPRTGDTQTIYLKSAITDPNIQVGDYTMYNDFVHDPRDFQRNNVLYHYPINGDKLVIGKFCSIACGAKFLFTSANHTLRSLSTYPFPLFFEEWGLDKAHVAQAWDNKGDITIGNDVWIGYEAVLLSGVTSSAPVRWSPRTCPPTPSWAASLPSPSAGASTTPPSTPCWRCAGGTGRGRSWRGTLMPSRLGG